VYVGSGKQAPSGSTCYGLAAPNNTGAGCASAYLAANGVKAAAGSPTQSTDPSTGGIAVTVKVQETPPNPFQGLLNIGSTRVASATAEAIPLSSLPNPVPIGVSEAAASQWQSGSPVTMTFTKNTLNSSSAQLFTILDLCGQGIPAIANCVSTASTCNCTLHVGDSINPDNGDKWCENGGQVSKAWNTEVGQQVALVVFDPNGNVAGFAKVIVSAETCNPTETLTGTFTGFITQAGAAGAASGSAATAGEYGVNSIAITQ
jgi:hypothetical protein